MVILLPFSRCDQRSLTPYSSTPGAVLRKSNKMSLGDFNWTAASSVSMYLLVTADALYDSCLHRRTSPWHHAMAVFNVGD